MTSQDFKSHDLIYPVRCYLIGGYIVLALIIACIGIAIKNPGRGSGSFDIDKDQDADIERAVFFGMVIDGAIVVPDMFSVEGAKVQYRQVQGVLQRVMGGL